jgi:alcohol dehydrogenase class IV
MLPRVEQLDLQCPATLQFGRGTVANVGGHCARHGDATLLVTDDGIVDAGLTDPVEASLSQAGVDYEVFAEVRPDPTLSIAVDCAARARAVGADSLVGLGGGSSMDVAKATAALLAVDDAGPEAADEVLGRDSVPPGAVPTVLVPTTAGTGSEVSQVSVLFDDRADGSGEKEAVIDDAILADTAVVDPDLAMHLPPAITKATGIDAFAHAMGCYMSTTSNTFADALCVEAMERIEANLRDATYHGADAPEAREQMSLAATMAMLGRVNGGKAATHSIAYGVQAMYDVPHAEAIAMVLPEVVEYNAPAATEAFARLGTRLYGAEGGTRERASALVDGVTRLRDDLGLDATLRSVGATEEDMPRLADLAVHSERHLRANPRPIDAADAETILRRVW